MEDSFFEEVLEIAKEAREILDSDPSQTDWVNEVAAQIDETGELPEDTWDKLSTYFLKYPTLRNRMLSTLQIDETGEQLMISIFNPQENILIDSDYDQNEEEEQVDDDDEIVIEAEKVVEAKKFLTIEDFKKQQQDQVDQIATTLNVSKDAAYCILINSGSIAEKAISSFIENPQPVFDHYGLSKGLLQADLGLRPAGRGLCEICYEDDVELFSLQCGHPFCAECWKAYIEQKVLVGQSDIRCQQANCHALVMMKDVAKMCGSDVLKAYENFLIDHQISLNPHLKRCLNPNCHNILTVDSVGFCMVSTCPCGSRMCWRCSEESHAPCSCENKEKWLDIADDEKIAAKWMHENTKLCPNCKTRIEKNGGCNHMTCWKCHHEFCWICGHDWKTHGGSYYECNRYKPETGKGQNELITDNVDRLSHYYARYQNHKKSLEIEDNNRQMVRERLIKSFVERKKDAIPKEEAVELADKILNTIKYSRRILLWSYPHAYYMEFPSVELTLFEHVQKDVEVYLEELTDLVENGYTNPPKYFEIPYKILAKNVEVLLKHVDSS